MKHAFEKLRDYCQRVGRRVVFGEPDGIFMSDDVRYFAKNQMPHTVESLARLLDQEDERQCHRELLEASRTCTGYQSGSRLWAAIRASDKVFGLTAGNNAKC